MDRQNLYPTNLSELLAVSAYQQNDLTISDDEKYNADTYSDNRYENAERSSSPSTLDDNESAFGVDLTGKSTNIGGKSFTIAAILGLTNEDDVMNLSVQERLHSQRQLQNYLYAGHEVQRINDGFCRSMVGVPTAIRQGNFVYLE